MSNKGHLLLSGNALQLAGRQQSPTQGAVSRKFLQFMAAPEPVAGHRAQQLALVLHRGRDKELAKKSKSPCRQTSTPQNPSASQSPAFLAGTESAGNLCFALLRHMNKNTRRVYSNHARQRKNKKLRAGKSNPVASRPKPIWQQNPLYIYIYTYLYKENIYTLCGQALWEGHLP